MEEQEQQAKEEEDEARGTEQKTEEEVEGGPKNPVCIIVAISIATAGVVGCFNDQITQLEARSVVLCQDGSFYPLQDDENQDFEQLVKCKCAITKQAEETTGITQAMLVNEQYILPVLRMFASHVQTIFSCRLLKRTLSVLEIRALPRVLVAHGGKTVHFPLIVAELDRSYVSPKRYMEGLGFGYFLDTQEICRDLPNVLSCLPINATNGRHCLDIKSVYKAVNLGASQSSADMTLDLLLMHPDFYKIFMRDVNAKEKVHLQEPKALTKKIVDRLEKSKPPPQIPNLFGVKKQKTMDLLNFLHKQ